MSIINDYPEHSVLLRRSVYRQFILFALVGAVATTVHYLFMGGLIILSAVHPVSATVAGFIAGALTGYLLNRRFTFRSRCAHRQALQRYLLVAGSGLSINTLIVALGIAAGLHYALAQVGATVLVLFWNFWANRYWTFGNG
ncbi:GtrA family protein [Thiorhodovibrio frisius]|uniref:Putative membrane protein n=1 Tax=Thiorhodovibrio frisius TaxID=631362 RepID=H8Z642_9GAMM|nr:GtrA family protein [Thiorhodovibrio frisius]EIC19609.1 putative membrane protein [Thiorhodovibrio frisius]WPL20426.1 GtrA-like protein [Thiorhodovibrio frisius]